MECECGSAAFMIHPFLDHMQESISRNNGPAQLVELRECMMEFGFTQGLQYHLASALDSLDYTIAMDTFHR